MVYSQVNRLMQFDKEQVEGWKALEILSEITKTSHCGSKQSLVNPRGLLHGGKVALDGILNALQ
jgi:hypothetical protein